MLSLQQSISKVQSWQFYLSIQKLDTKLELENIQHLVLLQVDSFIYTENLLQICEKKDYPVGVTFTKIIHNLTGQ